MKEDVLIRPVLAAPRQGKTLFLDLLLRECHDVIQITYNSSTPLCSDELSDPAASFLSRVLRVLTGSYAHPSELQTKFGDDYINTIRAMWLTRLKLEVTKPQVPCILVDELGLLLAQLGNTAAIKKFFTTIRRLLQPFQINDHTMVRCSMVYTGFDLRGVSEIKLSGMKPSPISLPKFTPDDLRDMLNMLLERYNSHNQSFPSMLWEVSKRSAGLLGHQLFVERNHVFENFHDFCRNMQSQWPKYLEEHCTTNWPLLKEYIRDGEGTSPETLNQLTNHSCIRVPDSPTERPSPIVFACTAVIVAEHDIQNIKKREHSTPIDAVLVTMKSLVDIANSKFVTFGDGPASPDKIMWKEDGDAFEKFILKTFELRHQLLSDRASDAPSPAINEMIGAKKERVLHHWQVNNVVFLFSCIWDSISLRQVLGDFNYYLFPEGVLPFLRDASASPDPSFTIGLPRTHAPTLPTYPPDMPLPKKWVPRYCKTFPSGDTASHKTKIIQGSQGDSFVFIPEEQYKTDATPNPGCEFAFICYSNRTSPGKEEQRDADRRKNVVLHVVLVEVKDRRNMRSDEANAKVDKCLTEKKVAALWKDLGEEFDKVYVTLLFLGRFQSTPTITLSDI